jgi:hypothetical protein
MAGRRKKAEPKGRWPLPATLSPGMWRIIFIVGKYSSSTYTQQPDSSWTSKRNPPFTTHLSYSNFSKGQIKRAINLHPPSPYQLKI